MRSPSIENTVIVDPLNTYNKKINIPTSKSRANRMLFLAAITPGETRLENVPDSSDVLDMMRSLRTIGLDISHNDNVVMIKNSFPDCEDLFSKDPVIVHCGYGGTTTRFLVGLLALGSREYHLEPEGHMRSRPMDEMLKPLISLGVDIDFDSDETWLKVRGPVKNKHPLVEVDVARSTQFASAIAMTMSIWGGRVTPINLHASEDYFKMTNDCIEQAKRSNWTIPIDFSSLSYPIALAALKGEVEILNYTGRDNFQPDSSFIDILKKMGAKVEESMSSLRVTKAHKLVGWSGDCSAFPDLVPTLCFINSFAQTDSILSHLEVLKHKECDRLQEMEKILKLFDRRHKVIDSSICTLPTNGVCEYKSYDAPEDHRMIMVAALFMKALKGGEIKNWHHIKKSYPYFFEDLAG